MKKIIPIFTIVIILITSIPSYSVFALASGEVLPTDEEYYEAVGAYTLGNLITTGEAEALDFTDSLNDPSFLIALGEALITENPTPLIAYGIEIVQGVTQEAFYSVCNWANEVAPDIYNALYYASNVVLQPWGTPLPKFDVQKSAYPLHRFADILKDRVTSDPIVPEPDVNYAPYLLLINGNTGYTSWYQSDFYLQNYSPNSSNISGHYSLQLIPSSFSFITKSYNYNPNRFNSNNYKASYISYINTNFYGNTQYACHPITIYINHAENSDNYIVSTSTLSQLMCLYDDRDGRTYSSFNYGYIVNDGVWGFNTTYDGMSTLPTFLYTGSLENCFKIISMNFRNVDIVVDGNLWSKGSFDPEDSNIYPIGMPESFDVLTGTQGAYYYPPDTFWNLNGLVDLIKQAIIDSGVVTYNDIAHLIVDVNGQEGVATINIVRTDYDNLISEQYPTFPTKYTGLKVPDLSDYSDVTKYIAHETSASLIPDGILVFLGSCGIILLIAYLINRMLE